jgi:hypothetical protein
VRASGDTVLKSFLSHRLRSVVIESAQVKTSLRSPAGISTIRGTENGGAVEDGSGVFSISPGGVISLVIKGESGKKSRTVVGVMDSTKTVFVGTSTWAGTTDPGTAELFISTKSASTPALTGVMAMPGSPITV